MPIWNIKCPCGGRESALVSNTTRENQGGMVPCSRCGALVAPKPSAPNLGGLREVFGAHGQKMTAAEADRWAEKSGKELLAPGTRERKNFEYEARERAEASARRFGYRGLDEYRERIKTDKVEFTRERQKKLINRYHDQHGSKGRQTPEQAFGPVDAAK